MIKSYRVFVSSSNIKKYSILNLAIFGAVLLTGIISLNLSDESVKDYIEKIMACVVISPVASLIPIANMYDANIKGHSFGYNYFHSLKNSAQHFKNAIIFGNIMSLCIFLLYGAMMFVFFSLENALIFLSIMFLSSGVMNLFGFKQSIFARIFPLAFLGGLVGAHCVIKVDEDIKIEDFLYVLTIIGIISVTVYIVGFFYAAVRAKSVWLNGEGREKHREKTENTENSGNRAEDTNKRLKKAMSKSQKQSGMSFLMKSVLRVPKVVLAFIILFALAAAVLPYIGHENIGSSDYLFPKIFVFLPSTFLMEVWLIFILRDLIGNKFVRSMPIAKKVYTRFMPASIVILFLGTSLVLLGSYFVFLGIINADISQYSDTLVIASIFIGSAMFFAPILMQTAAGGLFMIYEAAFPFTVIMLLISNDKKIFGFGVPLYLSAIIFLLVAILGTVWSFYYCSYRYKKADGKFYLEQNSVVVGK